MRTRIAAAPLLAWGLVMAMTLCAAADQEVARAAYDRATRAFEAGDYATAAREYARADELAPHDVALRWAIESAVKANDAVLAMNLALRADRVHARGGHDSVEADDLVAAREDARQRFGGRVGQLVLHCPPAEPCAPSVDGAAWPVGEPRYVVPGEHLVEIRVRDQVERVWATVVAQATVAVHGTPVPRAPVPAPGPRAPERFETEDDGSGISPGWIVLGAGITAALGGAAIWSGIDTLERHEAYLVARDPAGYDDGRAAELRTNLLIGATAAAGLGTLLFAIFAVDYGGEPEAARVSFGGHGELGLSLGGAF